MLKRCIALCLFFFTCAVSFANPKAVLFDTFGTIVDWRGSMIKEFDALFLQKSITHVDSGEFADAWAHAYSENIANIYEGRAPFLTVDELNKMALEQILSQYHISDRFTAEEKDHLWHVWHRLDAWPDSAPGIDALKKHFIVGALSNGNIRLLVDLSKHANLNWDVILSGELFERYKPDPYVYLQAAKVLNLEPSEIILVASHAYDLEAAKALGFKTAYVFRLREFGDAKGRAIPKPPGEFDYVVMGIDRLAAILNSTV